MNTEEQVKDIITKHKGSTSKHQIARELKMGLDYIGLVCRGLEQKRELFFSDGIYSFPAPKRKIVPKRHHNTRRAGFSLYDIPRMAKDGVYALQQAGYTTVESLADAPIARLMQAVKLEVHEAAGLINEARKMLGKIKDSEAVEDEKDLL